MPVITRDPIFVWCSQISSSAAHVSYLVWVHHVNCSGCVDDEVDLRVNERQFRRDVMVEEPSHIQKQ